MTGKAGRHDRSPAAVLAVDVGNSKTDVALVDRDGAVLAALRGPTTSHQAAGLEPGMDELDNLVRGAARQAGVDPSARPVAEVVAYCAAGVDVPSDERLLHGALVDRRFATTEIVRNDTFAILRAGTERTWGVAVICGAGVNYLGVAPNGRLVRSLAVGAISGDWGGGSALGHAALTSALRGRDRRGPRTALERFVPAAFGLRRPIDLTRAIYLGRIDEDRLRELSPVVFAAADAGDAVARAIVDHLADEVAIMANAAILRLHLTRSDPHVVLGGGVFRAEDAAFYQRIDERMAAVCPRATIRRLNAPPVVGSALIGLDRLSVAEPRAAESRLRAALTDAVLERGRGRT